MPDGGALSTGRLLVARALARRGLLASATATIAVAVAGVCTLLAWLSMSVAEAGGSSAPGVPAEVIAAQVDAGIVALVSAAPALVLLILILAGTAAAQLARLLAGAREQEHTNARARGLSPAQATGIDGLEAAAVAFVGAVAGLALALAASAAAGGVDATLAALTFWWVALATAAVLAVVLVAVPAARMVSGARRPGGSDRRGTRSGAVLILVLMLVVLAAAFTVWQLQAARPTGFDPIVAIAPALVLLAGAIVVLVVFGTGAVAWARPAATGQDLAPGYPARQVARRLPVFAVAVLLIGLTAAQTVFASAYSATWTAMATDSSALRAGADLRVDLEPQAATPELVAETAATVGVDVAAPALVTPVEIGSSGWRGDAQLIAVPTGAIHSVVTAAGGIIDRDGLAAGVAPEQGTVTAEPIPLGADAVGLSITATVQSTRAGGAGGLQLVATVLDARGAAAQVRLSPADPVAASGASGGRESVTVQGDLPIGTAPWSLLAVTATLLPNFGGTDLRVDLVEVGAIGGEPLPIAGEVQLDDGSREAVVWLADGSPASPPVSPPAVRAVLAADLADRLGLSVGDSLEFRYAGSGRRGEIEVGAIVPAVPGAATTRAIFAPLEILQVSMLQRGTSILPGSSVWADGDPDAAAALSSSLGDRPVATAAPGVTARIVGALVPGWWIATAGSVLLSLTAAVAIVQTLALARRRELGVLRALGVTRGAQARMRAAELAVVVGSALVLGAVVGGLVSWAVVPELVRAVTPGILPLGSGISLSWPVLASLLGVLVIGSAAIIAWATAGVHRAAGGATVGEDSR